MTGGRREFLRRLGGAAAFAALTGCAVAPSAGATLEAQRLSPRTLLIRAGVANVLAFRTSAGLVLVDGGSASSADAVREALRLEFGDLPIACLFNTHWHPEQTGLNARVAAEGGIVCAHENTRLWLSTEYYVDWLDRTFEPLPAPARPSRTFHEGLQESTIGGRSFLFGRLPNAHTDGDIFVHCPDEDVLAVGGALTPGAYPLMDYSTGGWLDGVIAASRTLGERAGEGTQLVAATGPVQRKVALKKQLDLATVVRERVAAGIKNGKSVQDMLDEGVTKEYDSEYGDPGFFVRSSYRGLWGHIRELGVA